MQGIKMDQREITLYHYAPRMLELLKKLAHQIEGSEHWWMTSYDRGGFDLGEIERLIALVEGE